LLCRQHFMHPPQPYVCTQFDQWVHAAEAIFGWQP
jgi:hypothetical protein